MVTLITCRAMYGIVLQWYVHECFYLFSITEICNCIFYLVVFNSALLYDYNKNWHKTKTRYILKIRINFCFIPCTQNIIVTYLYGPLEWKKHNFNWSIINSISLTLRAKRSALSLLSFLILHWFQLQQPNGLRPFGHGVSWNTLSWKALWSPMHIVVASFSVVHSSLDQEEFGFTHLLWRRALN